MSLSQEMHVHVYTGLSTLPDNPRDSRLVYENNLNAKRQSLPFPVCSNFQQ